jgi:parvulin-like peptidyl-prolyl isomerase
MNVSKALLLAPLLTLLPAAAQQGDVLVRAKSFTITKQDFDAETLKVPEKDRAIFHSNQKRINDTLQNLVINRAIYEDAKRKGLDKDPLVQREMQIAQERAMAVVMLDRVGKQAPVGDLDVAAREIYRLEKHRFINGEKVNAAHILISTQQRDAAAARSLALDVRQKLIKKEKTFEELVAQYSEDPSAPNNKGELGMMDPNRTVKPFAAATAKLKNVGDISDVVETDFGFHVIQLRGRVEGVVQPYEDVKDVIIDELKAVIAKRAKNAYTSDLIESEKAEANTEAVASLRKEVDFAGALKKAMEEQAAKPNKSAPAQAQPAAAPKKK